MCVLTGACTGLKRTSVERRHKIGQSGNEASQVAGSGFVTARDVDSERPISDWR